MIYPVLIDTIDESLTDEYRFEPVPHGWYRVLPGAASGDGHKATSGRNRVSAMGER